MLRGIKSKSLLCFNYVHPGGKGLDVAGLKEQLAQAATTAQAVTRQRNSGDQAGFGNVNSQKVG